MRQGLTINEETVLYYHNLCITDLRYLAGEPEAIMDENLLAAAVILRFYEELDNITPSHLLSIPISSPFPAPKPSPN